LKKANEAPGTKKRWRFVKCDAREELLIPLPNIITSEN